MKYVKATVLTFIAALLVFCTACGGETVPEGMDRETLLSEGQWVLLRLVEGDYEAVYDKLRVDQRAQITVDDIRDVVEAQLSDAGSYKQIEDRMVTAQTIDGNQYGIAVFYCEFSEEDVLVRISFDLDMRLVGFALQQD